MITIVTLLRKALRVKDILKESGRYWAHLPAKDYNIQKESLSDHLELVFKYLTKICNDNELDDIIDKLINSIVLEKPFYPIIVVKNYIKELFVDTVVFHDFGKVNENFQVDRMQNPLFQKLSTIIKPAHGHSELGTFIYLIYHLERINKNSNLTDDEKVFLSYIAFLFGNSITLHHSSGLVEPFKKLVNSSIIRDINFVAKYVKLYEIPESEIATSYFDNLQEMADSVSGELTENQYFPFFALSKLNYSLLTASDYLATSEYMNQKEMKDTGLITEELRERIIASAQNSQMYNMDAFKIADTDVKISNPIEVSGYNLNVLRRNMVVEVIRTVRKNNKDRLFYLEAPTGGGKTNISMLIIAELLRTEKEINKVFYVFPFTTLITQTHKAIIKTLGLSEAEISLLHSKAGFQSRLDDDDYGDKKMDYINNLFVNYPFCLVTHIRFFDIIKTNEKETNYLLHRLANSIIIIDELQSYSPKQWDKILYFIQNYAFFFNMRFVLMSATLPRIDKLNLPLVNRIKFRDLLPNAKDFFTNPNFSERVIFRFDYRNQKLEISDLASIVLKKSELYSVERGKDNVFTIVEFIFKESASEFESAIDGRFFDKIFVLSGTILEPRRREIINFLKNKNNRNQKVLLITTQVVEAGVDIDMDLGFKNVSLIDSDEQLAGRVNRNVNKATCEVYLFQINQPSILYKQDERYFITRDKITSEEHEYILKNKSFERLYNLVFSFIDKINKVQEIQNFNSDYFPEIKRLDYRQIHEKFQLIDQQTLSVFVPLKLKKQIISDESKSEDIFSKGELEFLAKIGVDTSTDLIDGFEVWSKYKIILDNKLKDFLTQQIDKKLIGGILSKFTFSIFADAKIKLALNSFGFPADDRDNELRGFDSYIFLAHYEQCYNYERGLNEKQFEASENLII